MFRLRILTSNLQNPSNRADCPENDGQEDDQHSKPQYRPFAWSTPIIPQLLQGPRYCPVVAILKVPQSLPKVWIFGEIKLGEPFQPEVRFVVGLHIHVVSPGEDSGSSDAPPVFDWKKEVDCSTDFVKEIFRVYLAVPCLSVITIVFFHVGISVQEDLPVGFILVLLKCSHMTEDVDHSRAARVWSLHHQVLMKHARWSKVQFCFLDQVLQVEVERQVTR